MWSEWIYSGAPPIGCYCQVHCYHIYFPYIEKTFEGRISHYDKNFGYMEGEVDKDNNIWMGEKWRYRIEDDNNQTEIQEDRELEVC